MLGVAKVNKQQLFSLKTDISANIFQKPSSESNKYYLLQSSTSFTSAIFYTAKTNVTCSLIDYIVLVGFFNRIFDIIKFQVTCDACPFSKILSNVHLFVLYREAKVYEI